MSAGYELPEHLFIHGYLKLGGEKMSKTRGNVMDPFPLIERYGADPFRFYCLREVSFGQDGMVSEEGFKARYNTRVGQRPGQPGVADGLHDRQVPGRRRPGAAPLPRRAPTRRAPARRWRPRPATPRSRTREQLEEMDLSGALETVWVFVRRLNRYVEEQAPWKLAKEAGAEGPAGG